MVKASKYKTKNQESALSHQPNESKKKAKKQASKVKEVSHKSSNFTDNHSSFDGNDKSVENNKGNYIYLKPEPFIMSPNSFNNKSLVKVSKSPRKESKIKSSNIKLESISSPNPIIKKETKSSSIQVQSNENLTISSPRNVSNRLQIDNMIKPQNINSFSVVSPKKQEVKTLSIKEIPFGSLKNDSPLKIMGLRSNKNDKNDLECLVSWKTKLNKQKVNDSVVNSKEIRTKYPELLLDFYEDRLKFNLN